MNSYRFRVGLVFVFVGSTLLPSANGVAAVVQLADLAPGPAGGVPEVHAAVLDDTLYFRASADGSTFDLWAYDGATSPVQVPGGEGIDPRDLVVFQGQLYFRAVDGDGDAELWRLDQFGVPQLAVDLYGAGSGDPRVLFPWESAGLLCYQVVTDFGRELGCWDGVGTPAVYHLGGGFVSSDPADFAVLGNLLVFAATLSPGTRRLVAFDGASAPTPITLDGTHPLSPREMVVADGWVYFYGSAPGTSVATTWRWDGVLAPEPFGMLFNAGGPIALWRGRPHQFLGGGVASIWRLDGATMVQVLVNPLVSTANFSTTTAGGAIHFVAGSGGPGFDHLVRVCGSEILEVLTAEFDQVDDGVLRSRLVEFAGRLYFGAFDATSGAELWSVPLDTIFCDGFADSDFRDWSAVVP